MVNVYQLLKREMEIFPDMNEKAYWNLCDKYHLTHGVPYSVVPIKRKGRLVGDILYRMYKFHTNSKEVWFVANTQVHDMEVWHYAFGCCDSANRQIAERLIAKGKDRQKQHAYSMSLYYTNYKIEDEIRIEGDGFFKDSLLMVMPKDVIKALKHTGHIMARL